MKNNNVGLLTVSALLLLCIACHDPVTCPFQNIQFVEENSRNQASLELSNELKVALQLPTEVPIQVEDLIKVGGKVKLAADRFVRVPIDSYLAGSLNAYLQGTICNTFCMAQLAKPDQQVYYDSLLRVQFATLTGFMGIYSQGKVPAPLPDGPLPPVSEAADASAIYDFFEERIAAAKTEAERQEWRQERADTEVYILSCRKEKQPADCIRDLLRALRRTHTLQ